MSFKPGDVVRWLVNGISIGVVTDRTKDGQYRPSPDARGYVLVDWGGWRRWCSQLELLDKCSGL